MLVLWPILIAGTLVGTVLLITLPLGAMVWFLVLILARSACRAEVSLRSATTMCTSDSILRENASGVFTDRYAALLSFATPQQYSQARLLYNLQARQGRTRTERCAFTGRPGPRWESWRGGQPCLGEKFPQKRLGHVFR